MQTTAKRIFTFATSIRGLCGTWFFVALASSGITVAIVAFYLFVGRHFLTGKTVFLHEYGLGACFVVIAYSITFMSPHKWNLRSLPLVESSSSTEWKWFDRVAWLGTGLCTIALATMWLWADIVDSVSAVLFVVTAHLCRIWSLRGKDDRGWMLCFLAGGFALLTNADKVVGYPYEGRDKYYLGEYFYWTAIHCYAIHQLLYRYHASRVWVCVALVVLYFPVLELPSELARQFFGQRLTGSLETVYYTKLRPKEIYGVKRRRSEADVAIFFERDDKGVYRKKGSQIFAGQYLDDKMPNQSLRTPSLALRINGCHSSSCNGCWRILRETLGIPTSDEEMIRHFTSNRADFQKLVDLLRSDVVCGIRSSQADSTRPYTEVRDITQLEQRLRVKAPLWFYLFRDRDYGLWFAGPYSIETASKIKALTPDERKQAYCKYGTIVLKAGDSRYPSMPWFYGDLRKDFCHFPEPPKVEDGYLLGPVDVNGHVTKKWRILNRSDPYPSDWKRGESVFIQLSPQWFMRLRHF